MAHLAHQYSNVMGKMQTVIAGDGGSLLYECRSRCPETGQISRCDARRRWRSAPAQSSKRTSAGAYS